jgi:hypothetical protein
MIDCGSSHCFIDSHYAKVNHFPIVSIPQMRLHLIDRPSPSYIVLRKLSWLGHMTAELDISENQFSSSLACGSWHIGLAQLST